MNFGSLKEYFYKLVNRCYLFILLPLTVFIYLYRQLEIKSIAPVIQDEWMVEVITVSLIALALVNLTTVHWLSVKRLRKYSAEIGLGRKLDRYYEVIMFRMKACSASSLMMAVGMMLTGSQVFGISFIVILLWTLLMWPTSSRACRDLRLKGDEYEMVLYKKDKF